MKKHESGVTLKWAHALLSSSLSTEAQTSIFTRENLHFYNRMFSTIGFRFWRLLGRLQKEGEKNMRRKKGRKRQNKRKEKRNKHIEKNNIGNMKKIKKK